MQNESNCLHEDCNNPSAGNARFLILCMSCAEQSEGWHKEYIKKYDELCQKGELIAEKLRKEVNAFETKLGRELEELTIDELVDKQITWEIKERN